jgi:hypothetical protein
VGLTAPAPSMGDTLPPAEVVGHLLLIAPTGYETGIVTKFTKHDDKPSEAVRCDIAVLTAQNDRGEYGVVYRGVLWFNVIRLSLRKSIPDTANGDAVLARMGQGQAQQGQDPPYVLVDATADADAVAFAENWLTQNPEFMAVAVQTAKQSAAAPAASAPPAGQTVPGVAMDAGPRATAPVVAPVPTAKPAPAPVALPGMGGQNPGPAGAAGIPAAQPPAAADLLAALGPEEKAQLLAALTAQH